MKDISFDVQKGEIFAFLGPNGAGKSTTIKMLTTLLHPTSGEIIIDGQNTQTMTSEERTEFRLKSCGYVFQDYALLPELTAV